MNSFDYDPFRYMRIIFTLLFIFFIVALILTGVTYYVSTKNACEEAGMDHSPSSGLCIKGNEFYKTYITDFFGVERKVNKYPIKDLER